MPRHLRRESSDGPIRRRSRDLRKTHRRFNRRRISRRCCHPRRNKEGTNMLNNRARVRAFTGPGAEQRAEKVGHWFKALVGQEAAKAWCIENGVGLTKATNESLNITGGFLPPQDFDAAIISIRETVGAFRQGAEIRPTRSDGQIRPRRTGGLTANFVAEGATIPESSFQLDAVESVQKKF